MKCVARRKAYRTMRGVRPMTYGSKPRLSAKKRASGRISMTSRSARANHPLRTRTAKKRERHKPKRDAVFVEYGERVAKCGKKAYRKSPDHNDRDFCFYFVCTEISITAARLNFAARFCRHATLPRAFSRVAMRFQANFPQSLPRTSAAPQFAPFRSCDPHLSAVRGGEVTRRPRELLPARHRRKRRERGWRTPCSALGLCGGTPWASRCIPP